MYDTETKKTKTILDNPNDFYSYYVYNQELFVFTRENLLMKFDWQGEVIEEIEIEGVWSNQVIPSGDYLLYRDDGDLCLYHKKTKERTVLYFGKSPYNVDLNTVAADDENIFVSVQRRKPEGLSENNIEHEDNGLWRVDPETLEYKKVLSDVFYELFLVDGMLFGRKGDQIYRIDTKTFATEPMLG